MLRLAARRVAAQVQQSAALASAPARGIAAQAPATKDGDLNWEELEESVASTDNGKRELQLLRSTFLDVQQKHAELTKDPEPIDWAGWKKEGVDPALVDAFRKAYDSMPLPKYEDDSLEEVQKSFDALVSQAGDLAAHSESRMKEIQQEIDAIDKELARVKSLTIDEVLASEPELGKRLHAEISEGKFIP